MTRTGKERRKFLVLLTLGLLLVVTGLVMLSRVFSQYNALLSASQDEQLYYLARAIDRNMDNILDNCREDFKYVINRRGFLEAEHAWQEGGDAEKLKVRMQENLITQNDLFHAMLAVEGDQVLVSTDDSLDYRLILEAGAPALRPCIGADGTVYLALLETAAAGDVQYAALLDLKLFYGQVVRSDRDDFDQVLLMDGGGRILLHIWQGEICVEPMEQTERPEKELFLAADASQARAAETYALSELNALVRVVVLPTSLTDNGAFSVGIRTNYDALRAPLRIAAIRLIAYGGMVVAGVILLLAMALGNRRKMEQNQRELAVLKEKNTAMESLVRQTQELAHHQRLESLGTLTSSIAHEFNNLLTPIMGYSLMILEKLPPDDENLYDDVLEIYNASKKARTIISRLSDLSRKNSSLTFQYLSPNELVQRTLDLAAPARPQNVGLETKLACRDVWIYGNETQLIQMLLNLVLNAFQAMEKTGGTVTVASEMEAEHIRFRVTDTGPGIDPAVLPQIFEPFFTTKESGKGTGLGLAIVQQVVEQNGGTVEVRSEVGKGTTFLVDFPSAVLDEKE